MRERMSRATLQLFQKAVDELGLGQEVLLLYGSPSEGDHTGNAVQKAIARSVVPLCEQYLRHRGEVLSQAGGHVAWGNESESVEGEILSLRAFHAGVIAAAMGEKRGLETLLAQAMAEPLNRKYAVSVFLDDLTDGEMGRPEGNVPDEKAILAWVSKRDSVVPEDQAATLVQSLEPYSQEHAPSN